MRLRARPFLCLVLLLGLMGPLIGRSVAAPATKVRIAFEGRQVDIYPPAGRPRAIVVLLHGFDLTSADIAKSSQLIGPGTRQGLLIVIPNGISGSWNAGLCCGTAVKEGVDDVAYLADLVTAIRARRHLTRAAPTIMGGFSDGAMMTEEFLCKRPGVVSGAILMAGNLQDPRCMSAHARAILEIKGLSDHTVPAGGQLHSNLLGTHLLPDRATERAAEHGLRCTSTLVNVTKPAGKGYRFQTEECGSETFTSLKEIGGHSWLHGTAGTRSATTPLILRMVRSLEPTG